MVFKGRQQPPRLYSCHSFRENSSSNHSNSKLWVLLAVTSWCFQFFLVARFTASELHENHSLVQGDHQKQLSSSKSNGDDLEKLVVHQQVEIESLQRRVAHLETPLKETISGIESAPTEQEKHDRRAKDSKAASDQSSSFNMATASHYNCTHEDGRLVTLQQVPAFIIIGVQKAGTSAMYDLLNLHPSIQGSVEPEAHFFDRRLPINDLRNPTNHTWAEQYRCKVREIYAKKFFPYDKLQDNPHMKFFDKTPSYVTSIGAPFRIKAIAPWSKVILSLRNPVDRAFSQHRMETQPKKPHLSFEERLGVSLDVLRRKNYDMPPDSFPRPSRELMSHNMTSRLEENDFWKERNIIHRGFYAEQLKPWLRHYTLGKDLLVVRYEQFKSDPETVLNQMFDFIGAERPPPNTVYTSETLSTKYGPGRLRGTEGEIAEVAPPAPGSLEFLAKLYKPYNDELADLLGEEWRGVWD